MAALVVTDQNDANFPDMEALVASPFQMVIDQLKAANEHLEKIDDSFAYVIDMLEANQLDVMEKEREKKDSSKRIGTPKGEEKQEEEDGSLGAMLLGVGAGLLVAGIAAALSNMEETMKKIKEILEEPARILESLQLATTDAIEALVNFWNSSIVENFQGLALKPVAQKIRAGINAVGTTLQKFGDDLLRTSSEFFKSMGDKFSRFGKFTKALGVLFRPVVIVFEGIFRAFDEFGKLGDDASMMDYVQAGLKVVVKTFLSFWTGLGDLIKSGFSWILEKLSGEDNAISNFLDRFSITEIMEKLVDMVFKGWNLILTSDWGKMFDDGVEIIKNAVSKLYDDITDWFSDIASQVEMMAKNFVAAILPNKDAFILEIPALSVPGIGEIVSPSTVDLNPIPDAIYQWAGEGAKQKISVSPDSQASQMATERRMALERDTMQGFSAGMTPPSVNVYNDQRVNNSSSTNVQQGANQWWGMTPSAARNRGVPNPVGYW